MSPATASRRMRRTLPVAAVGLSALAALLTAPGAGADTGYTKDCPRPENYVTGTTWHKHVLAKGVVLKEGRHTDRYGVVEMHVLRLDLTNQRLHFKPLVRRLAMRVKLSSLADGKSGLVAATNTGYFDFRYGTPGGPLVVKKTPWLASATGSRVIGWNKDGRVQAGKLALAATVTGGGKTLPLVGLNTLWPSSGLTVYTPKWGSMRLDMPSDAIGRYVRGGVAGGVGHYSYAPKDGFLVVARGSSAQTWLRDTVRSNTALTLTRGVKTDTKKPFVQAYGVGAQIVRPGGVARTDLSCRKSYPMPARTLVGTYDQGRKMMIVAVTDHPGSTNPDVHGLDANQAARLMADLGARQAFLFDGSGSTEMIARMGVPATPDFCDRRAPLVCRNYVADGQERPMPVGLGIFVG